MFVKIWMFPDQFLVGMKVIECIVVVGLDDSSLNLGTKMVEISKKVENKVLSIWNV